MKRTYWTLGLLFALSLFMTMSCSGEDPIKAKRIAIENGTYKPDPNKPDPNKPDPNKPDTVPTPEPNPLGDMKTHEITFTFDEWASPRAGAPYRMPVEKALPKLVAGEPYWESASNMGAALAGKVKSEDFPIHPLTKGRTGQALEAMTIKGMKFGNMGGHIIAGALYNGQFNKDHMIKKPLESTLFGQPVFAIPLSIKGYYQWLPGMNLVDGKKKNKEIEGQDEATIACVFYDISQDDSYLNGKNLYTAPRILAKVQLHPKPTKDGAWTSFEARLDIVNEAAYKQIDLQKGKYRMVLIFSSSARGDEFIGAIGSRLRIDDFVVTLGIPNKK
ncbi:PCMD domain-containing protein [Porphyromonas sp.]|uniref:PCMD domain-containing protein n=1 Tax=Porphyromonas sp. TaxID=1924944 RepID=UPI003AB6ADD8